MRIMESSSYDNLSIGARELSLTIDNSASLYSLRKAIVANMKRKIAAGKYDPVLAVKAWLYLVEAGAKEYAKENGTPGEPVKNIFPKEERIALAQYYAESEKEKIEMGDREYDDPV